VITGAGAGQGRAAAKLFAAEGASVVVAELDEASGQTAADEIIASGGTAAFVQTDVSQAEDWQTLVAAAEDSFGGIDVLYNNAAVFSPEDTSFETVDLQVWAQVLAVNLTGPMLGCRHTVSSMRRRGGGSIINTSSIRAFVGTSTPQDAYTAAKGALISLTRSLAVQLGPDAIRVNAIAPGTVVTAMADLHGNSGSASRLARYPLGRFGGPEEIANLALYLASDESRWTSGATFGIEGAVTVNYI